jgi:hypothetical protein
VIDQEGRGVMHPAGGAGRTERSRLARVSEESLGFAAGALHAHETAAEVGASQEGLEFVNDMGREARRRIFRVEGSLAERLEVLSDDLPQE